MSIAPINFNVQGSNLKKLSPEQIAKTIAHANGSQFMKTHMRNGTGPVKAFMAAIKAGESGSFLKGMFRGFLNNKKAVKAIDIKNIIA